MTTTHSSLIGQVCSAGSKLLVQSTVFDKFIGKLKTRLGHFRIGHSLDKTIDMAAIVDESQRRSVAEFVEEARGEGAEVFQTPCPPGCFYPPTLITGVSTASRVVMEEIFGPVLVALPFRSPELCPIACYCEALAKVTKMSKGHLKVLKL